MSNISGKAVASGEHNSHFYNAIFSATDDLICNKVYAIYFIRMSRQVRSDLVGLQVPYLHKNNLIICDLQSPKASTHLDRAILASAH
jgi:hypothetical protein